MTDEKLLQGGRKRESQVQVGLFIAFVLVNLGGGRGRGDSLLKWPTYILG